MNIGSEIHSISGSRWIVSMRILHLGFQRKERSGMRNHVVCIGMRASEREREREGERESHS